MLDFCLSYKPPNSWIIIVWSEGRPSQFSHLKKFRYLVIPGGGYHKGGNSARDTASYGSPAKWKVMLDKNVM